VLNANQRFLCKLCGRPKEHKTQRGKYALCYECRTQIEFWARREDTTIELATVEYTLMYARLLANRLRKGKSASPCPVYGCHRWADTAHWHSYFHGVYTVKDGIATIHPPHPEHEGGYNWHPDNQLEDVISLFCH
jgi:hypothetical protein